MKKQTPTLRSRARSWWCSCMFSFFRGRQDGSGVAGVFAYDTKFVPLSVDEPQLRLDLLASLKKLEYTGSHRDIFSAVALPVVQPGGPAPGSKPPHPYPTVTVPPPIPPPVVPGTLYGFAAMKESGKRGGILSRR